MIATNALTRLADRIHIDWHMFVPALLVSLSGLVTMNSFSGENYFFHRQSIWILVSVAIFLIASSIDWRFLRSTRILMPIFLTTIGVLLLLSVIGQVVKGSQSWFQLGSLNFQPSDIAKLVTVLILAKYFSRRHVEIRNIRHIIVSGIYTFLVFVLVFLEPDFGSAMIIFALWFGMVLISGISKKHLFYVVIFGVLSACALWFFVLAPYQKARIATFINPLSDIRGAGYNAYQSTIAVGSGGIWGKGIGQGSQSKLRFLPEYQTDFIFAAFAEEWGFIGASLLLALYFYLLFRVISNAEYAATNFESLFCLGFAVLLVIHAVVHVGMNLGLVPVTGVTFPFMSYGGSHLVAEWFALGMISSMTRHSRGPRELTSRS